VGASRLLLGDSTSAVLLGDAAGGPAGNMVLDRQREERQRALQAEQTRIEIEEQRLFNEWRRQQAK
jgi:hypothetical protein